MDRHEIKMRHLNWLCHHGVEGQKWGVRHGPPYPIEDHILRAGTRVRSVSRTKKSNDYKNTGRIVYTYRSDDDHDAEIYRGPFTHYLRMGYSGGNAKSKVFEHEFEVLRDLKMPSSKQRLDEFVKIYNSSSGSKRQTFTDELNRVFSDMKGSGLLADKIKDYNLSGNTNKTLSGKSAKSAYTVFNVLMESSHGYEITREYVKNIKAKWDAMVDDNNVNIYNNAHDPIMFFNPTTDLKSTTKKGRFISRDEMLRDERIVKNKNNGRVMY